MGRPQPTSSPDASGTTAPGGEGSPSPSVVNTSAPSRGGARDAGGGEPSVFLTVAPTVGGGDSEDGGSFSPTAAADDRGSVGDTQSPELPLLVSRLDVPLRLAGVCSEKSNETDDLKLRGAGANMVLGFCVVPRNMTPEQVRC